MKKTTFSLSAAIGALAVLASSSAPHAAPAAGSKPAKSYFLYVGSYTRVTGKGIYGYRFNPATGEFAPLGLIQEVVNPGWLSETPDHRFIFGRLPRATGRAGKLHHQRLRPGCQDRRAYRL